MKEATFILLWLTTTLMISNGNITFYLFVVSYHIKSSRHVL